MNSIAVRLKRIDLVRLALYAMLHSAALKWTVLILAVVIFAINVGQQRSRLDLFILIAIVITTVIFAAAGLVAMLALNLLSVLLRNGKSSAATQVQNYSFADGGLYRQSASSNALLNWGGARSVRKNKNAIYIGASAASYFVLPRHSFASDEEYESFWTAAQKLGPSNRTSQSGITHRS